MKDIKWIFVIYSVAAAFSIVGIGVSIGERSAIGIVCCIIAVILIMGFGFKTKKKMREAGRL